MRRRLGWVALTAVLPLVAAGCAATATDEPVLDGFITVGVALEKSGPASALGDGQEKAIQLAADRINKEGVLGRRIKLLITDTRSNDAEAVRQVTALADNNEVVGIIGPGTTATTMPVLPVIENKKIPLISMGAAETIVNPVDAHRFSFKTPQNGQAIVEVMMRELLLLRINKIGLLAADNEFGDYGVQALTAAAKQANISLVAVQRFKQSDKDYRAQIAALAAAGPQAILVSAIMPGAGIAAKNIKEAKYPGRVFFDPGAGSEVFLSAGSAAEDMFMVHSSILAANHITATTPSVLAQKEFFAAYTQRHGTFSGYASYAADALYLMVAAMKKSGSTDRNRIRDTLETLEFDGLTGSYKFSPTSHGGASGDGLTVLTVHKGGWILAP